MHEKLKNHSKYENGTMIKTDVQLSRQSVSYTVEKGINFFLISNTKILTFCNLDFLEVV